VVLNLGTAEEFKTTKKLIIIILGTNDSAANENQHIPIDKYKENLGHIIDHVLKFSKLKHEKIIVISPGLFVAF
jgi:hypothetical protein